MPTGRHCPVMSANAVHKAITALATTRHGFPQASRDLNTGDLDLPAGVEIRRVRLNRWRIIYAVHDDEQWVWILGLQRRPPYDYSDLAELVARLQPVVECTNRELIHTDRDRLRRLLSVR